MYTDLDSCIEWMIPELHSEVIVSVHLPLQPRVNAARICIEVHDHLFIVEDCKHAQTCFVIWLCGSAWVVLVAHSVA